MRIFFLILTIALMSIGQILFKVASHKVIFSQNNLFLSLIKNPILIIALAIYALATLAWIYVLKITPLTIAYPFSSLTLIIVPILAYYILNEPLRLSTFVGAGIIIFGIYVSTIE